MNKNEFMQVKADYHDIIVPQVLKGGICCLGKVSAKVTDYKRVVFKDAFGSVKKEFPDYFYEVGTNGMLNNEELIKLRKIIDKEKGRGL